MATTFAFNSIERRVKKTDSLTVRHVINKTFTPPKSEVPRGPYSEDKFRKIVAATFEDAIEKRDHRWDRTKNYVPWILRAIALALTSAGMYLAYLKFGTGPG